MTRSFGRWLGKADLVVEALCKAIEEMERGLVDAKLGGGIVKKRIALPGRGKRGQRPHTGCDKQSRPLVFRIWIRKKRSRQYRR